MNNNHPDENDTRRFERCACCGRTVEMPSRDDDHAAWCANRTGMTDDEVEAFARERGETGRGFGPGYADTVALTNWRLALMKGSV